MAATAVCYSFYSLFSFDNLSRHFVLQAQADKATRTLDKERAAMQQVKQLWREIITKLKTENEALIQANAALMATAAQPLPVYAQEETPASARSFAPPINTQSGIVLAYRVSI